MAPLFLVFTALAAITCFVNGQSVCTTADGVSGTCKSLDECLEGTTKSETQLDLDKESQCSSKENVSKVCCPNPCYTPSGEVGTCIRIFSCPHLAKLLKAPVAKAYMEYVQDSKCKSSDKYSVCCGPPREPEDLVVPDGNCASTVTAFPPDPRTECCGVDSSFGDRIVGGNATTVEQYPWLVIIEYVQRSRVKLLCGGALISGRYVLSAAHCVTGSILKFGRPTNVRLGEYDTKNDGKDCTPLTKDCNEGVTTIPIEQTIPHPAYNPNTKHSPNDIALIRLKQNAPFTDFIRPICLPARDVTVSPPVNFTMYAAGWGAVSSNQQSSNVKLHVDLPYVDKSICEPAYKSDGRNLKLTSGQLCAGGIPGKDSCKGDSGGPLMYENGRNYEIIGVVSFGPTPCGEPGVPGVYTNVYEYIDWIRSIIVA